MTAPAIVFRVDASATIGSGHLRRCLTLADALRDRGAQCIFICRAHRDNLNADVVAAGHTLIELPEPAGPIDPAPAHAAWLGVPQLQDAAETCAALASTTPVTALVIDHYGLDATWERAVARLGGTRIALDDLADRPHDVELLIDVTPGDAARYADLLPAAAARLLGPAYALLQPEYRKLRRRTDDRDGPVSTVLVSFGAVDTDDRCTSAIAAIRTILGTAVAIDIVVGRFAPHLDGLRAAALDDPELRIHVDTAEMAMLMARADLAIGAGGTTSWERACLGVPSIVCAVAANQHHNINALARSGAAIRIDGGTRFQPELRAALHLAAVNPGLLSLGARRARQLVDGRGTERVAAAILPAAVTLRVASSTDSADIWSWRNADAVRQSSKSNALIAWDDHARWFAAIAVSATTDLLIGDVRGEAVGVIRFDCAGSTATVSIYLTPGGRGRGNGVALLRAGEAWLARQRPGIAELSAEILPDNPASIAAFEEAGYVPALLQYGRGVSRAVDR